MKKNILLTLTLFSGLCMAGLAHAEAPTTASTTATPVVSAGQSAQTNRMKACAQQYHQQNIPKNQYHTFMSGCLKKGSTVGSTAAATPAPAAAPASGVTPASTAPAAATQQDKMKSCSKDAKAQNLSGDARKTFMKSCLSK